MTEKLFTGETKQPKTNTQTDWTKFLKAGTDKLNAKDYDGAIKAYTECLNSHKPFCVIKIAESLKDLRSNTNSL